jgi:PEP-CTERM motif
MKFSSNFRTSLATLVSAASLALCVSASAQTFTGSITLSDPTENGRLFRDGVPSVSGTQKPFPGISGSGTFYHYDSYILTNPFATTTAFTITLSTTTAGVFPFSVAYLGAFNPANIATNYLGDAGTSADSGVPTSFMVDVPAGATFTLVVNEVTAGAGVADYTLNIAPSTTVPEPSTTSALLVGAIGLGLYFGWRRNSSRSFES